MTSNEDNRKILVTLAKVTLCTELPHLREKILPNKNHGNADAALTYQERAVWTHPAFLILRPEGVFLVFGNYPAEHTASL